MKRKELSPLVKGLRPGLTERGKIKIGIKGETRHSQKGTDYQLPQKLDHFVITTLEKDNTGNFVKDYAIHEKLGDNPKRVPIMLLFDDIALNFQSRYACYQGKTLFCTGDGENAIRKGVDDYIECPCERSETDYVPPQDRCKMLGVLSCIIRGIDSIGGVYKFRTTSYNSIQGITSSLAFIKQITGGPLMGIELDLVLGPKTTTSPDGKTQTIYVVGIEYTGGIEQLRDEGLKALSQSVHHRKMLASVEHEVANIINVEVMDVDDVVEEFFPENAEGYEPPPKDEIQLDISEPDFTQEVVVHDNNQPETMPEHTGEPVLPEVEEQQEQPEPPTQEKVAPPIAKPVPPVATPQKDEMLLF